MKHIRIVSPAGAIDPNHVTQAKKRLESWGFGVSLGAHVFGQYGRFSGTIDERLEDLNAAFADATVDIILCSRGGYGLQQIVDKIVLPKRPKEAWPLVVGFSDVTILHALMGVHGVASLHAPMCKAIATLSEEDSAMVALRKALEEGRSWQQAYGTVVGGNLSVLYGLQGTPYSLHAVIDQCGNAPMLLLEDICERHYHIDRMMNNLRMSGVLDRVSGVIVGQFTDCDDDVKMGCSVRESIARILSQYDMPVVWDAPYGHEDGNMPIYFL